MHQLLFVALLCAPLLQELAPAAEQSLETSARPTDPVEPEYLKILLEDDRAQDDADRWIREAEEFERAGATAPLATLRARIEQRFEQVDKLYEDFLRSHPSHVSARLAYGSFLNDTYREEEAVEQWEKARQLDPSNPAAWNNLANHFGHRGPVKKAFEYYAEAIELNPNEPTYYRNLATTTYLFRKDAIELYKIEESEVFDRALELYRRAMKLDSENFTLAQDYAQSFYGIKPLRSQEALDAWKNALRLASDAIERQGVLIHLARVELNSGQFDEARTHLDEVTLEMYQVLKNRLNRNLEQKIREHDQPTSVPTGFTQPN